MTNKNKDIQDLTNNETPIELDEMSPEELDQISGGVSVEEEDDEADCGVNCNVNISKPY